MKVRLKNENYEQDEYLENRQSFSVSDTFQTFTVD